MWSSASLLPKKGVDVLVLKRHWGCRSSDIAERYVESSIEIKNNSSRNILHNEVLNEATMNENLSIQLEVPNSSSIISSISTDASTYQITVINSSAAKQFSKSVKWNNNRKSVTGNNSIAFNNCTFKNYRLLIGK